MKEAELIAIFDEDKVYLVGNKSINNLKSVILEGLLFTGTYAIDKGNYRTIDIATKTVKHLVTNYKKNIKIILGGLKRKKWKIINHIINVNLF